MDDGGRRGDVAVEVPIHTAALLSFALGFPVPRDEVLARRVSHVGALHAWEARVDRAACRLHGRPMDDPTVAAWVALQRLDSATLPARNADAHRVYWDNDHHKAAQHWGAATTILHVDSHPDLSSIPLDSDAVHLPDQPLALAVARGARRIVWAKPPWAVLGGSHAVTLSFGPLDTGERGFQLVGGVEAESLAADLPEAARSVLETIPAVPPDGVAVRYEALPIGPEVVDQLIGEPFLLSLDLDTFATNGHPDWPGTPCSDMRVDPLCGEGNLDEERGALEARLSTFSAMMMELAGSGARPTLVSIADSTFQPRSACAECTSGWDFTPPEWVAWLRWRVRHILARAWPELGPVVPCAALGEGRAD